MSLPDVPSTTASSSCINAWTCWISSRAKGVPRGCGVCARDCTRSTPCSSHRADSAPSAHTRAPHGTTCRGRTSRRQAPAWCQASGAWRVLAWHRASPGVRGVAPPPARPDGSRGMPAGARPHSRDIPCLRGVACGHTGNTPSPAVGETAAGQAPEAAH